MFVNVYGYILSYKHIHNVYTFHREGGAAVRFTLSAGFPPKDVTDSSANIKDAGLLGAAITQKSA